MVFFVWINPGIIYLGLYICSIEYYFPWKPALHDGLCAVDGRVEKGLGHVGLEIAREPGSHHQAEDHPNSQDEPSDVSGRLGNAIQSSILS